MSKSDGMQCQDCGARYQMIYRVPNEVWTKIAPQPETLGPYIEHQFGGLLCIACADARARELGIRLYWDSSDGDWATNKWRDKYFDAMKQHGFRDEDIA